MYLIFSQLWVAQVTPCLRSGKLNWTLSQCHPLPFYGSRQLNGYRTATAEIFQLLHSAMLNSPNLSYSQIRICLIDHKLYFMKSLASSSREKIKTRMC